MFNHVAPYRYLLPTMYLFMADIEIPYLFVCGCRTCICLDIARVFMRSSASHPSGLHGCLLGVEGVGGLDQYLEGWGGVMFV